MSSINGPKMRCERSLLGFPLRNILPLLREGLWTGPNPGDIRIFITVDRLMFRLGLLSIDAASFLISLFLLFLFFPFPFLKSIF